MKGAVTNTRKQSERVQLTKKMLDYGTVVMWKGYPHQFMHHRLKVYTQWIQL